MTGLALSLLSFLFGTTLAFFTSAFISRLVLSWLPIRRYRLRYFLRLFPFGAIFLDLAFFNSSLADFFNPFNCESCVQKFVLALFPKLQEHLMMYSISLMDYLSFKVPAALGGAFVGGIGLVSGLFGLSMLLYVMRAYKVLKKAIGKGLISTRQVKNPLLQERLEKRRVKIIESTDVEIPMALTKNVILVPSQDSSLSQQEWEAVIAHELEHLSWKDAPIKFSIHVIASIFWWIPMSRWIQKMEEDQEMGCDQEITKYGFAKEALAAALVKVASRIHGKECRALCYLARTKSPALRRIEAIALCYPKEPLTVLGSLILVLGLGVVCLCLWP